MKTKLLSRKISNCKNHIFTFLIIFLMTITSFSQSDGINFACGPAVTFSFNSQPAGEVNGYSYWTDGTDNANTGDSYLLFVQTLDSIPGSGNGGEYDRWEVHVAGANPFPGPSPSDPLDPNTFGILYFYSPPLNGVSPPCDVNWIVDSLVASFLPCTSLTPTCFGSPIVDCEDADNDGFTTCDGDCDDTVAAINPGVDEVPYNGIDDDCNPATLDDDLDQDGYVNADDCDDLEFDVFPGATEFCDGLDNNCDGQIDEGIDGCIDGVIIEYCDDKQKKVLICHNDKTICVSINAMDAHLAHGDYLGTCGGSGREAEVLAEETPTSYDVVSWPNPTSDSFNVKLLTPNTTDKVSLEAFDINGRLIHSNEIKGNEDYQFGNQLNSGIYFVRLSQADKTKVVKLIKQ